MYWRKLNLKAKLEAKLKAMYHILLSSAQFKEL